MAAKTGVEAAIIRHIDTSESGCLIVGNDMRGFLIGNRWEAIYTPNQITGALNNLVSKGYLAFERNAGLGTRQYRLTDAGMAWAKELRPVAGPRKLWV